MTTQPNPSCRAEFEKWLKEVSLEDTKTTDCWGTVIYKHPAIDSMWFAWNASQSRILSLLDTPEMVEVLYAAFIGQLKKSGWTSCDYQYISSEKKAVSAIISAIKTQIGHDHE